MKYFTLIPGAARTAKRLVTLTAAALAVAAPLAAAEPSTVNPDALRRWQDWRFGLFVHWGPVSLKGTEIGWSRGAPIPIEEYDNLYRQFNPTNFNADEWMQVARAAGMKYVVFTSKHHDGFCMWDTKQTDFNVMRSPFGRDVVKELAAAARRHGLAFGTYHSVCDWHHPDFPLTSPGGRVRREVSNLDRYEQYLRAQVKELIENYGPLHVMWFDVPQAFDAQRGQGLIEFTRALQPDIIINNRSGAPGDYDTPEQRIGKYQDQRPWETCMTICHQWAWKPNDAMKSLNTCLRTLVLCAGGDGNLLFNVGPMPDGRIEPRQVARLKEMGAWLAKYGTSIYGTRGGPWKPDKQIASTRRGNTIFLHYLRGEPGVVNLPPLPRRIVRTSVLTPHGARVRQTAERVTLRVKLAVADLPPRGAELLLRRKAPAPRPGPADVIVKLELDGSAMDLAPLALPTGRKATASNVFQNMADYVAEMAFDDDPHSRWATDAGTRQAWVAAEFERPKQIAGVTIREAIPDRVQRFEFQVRLEQEWQTVVRGTTLGPKFTRTFEPVTTTAVRLNILDATEGPTIAEIQLAEK